MHAAETHTDALARLLGDLEQHRRGTGHGHVQHHTDVLASVTAHLDELPLVHGMNQAWRFLRAVGEGALRSRAALGMAPLPSETYFGLQDMVYTAAGILYPDKQFAFVLSPHIEEDLKGDASPCDSGSLFHSLCPHLPRPPAPEIARLFLSFTLPSPQYREYLVHYVASCFDSALDYLDLPRPHSFPDPHGVLCANFTSRVFEVRFKERIPLHDWRVEAVFLTRNDGDRDWLRARKALDAFQQRGLGIDVRTCRGASDLLQSRVRDWIIERASRRARRVR